MQLMTEAITQVVHTSFNSIEERQEEISSTVTNILKFLCKAVELVKNFVDCLSATVESQTPSETSRMEETAPLVLVPPIMVQVSKSVVNFGTSESNHIVQDNDHIIIDFSSMHINEVYVVHSAANAKIKP